MIASSMKRLSGHWSPHPLTFLRPSFSSRSMNLDTLLRISHERLQERPRQIYSFNKNDNKWIASDPSPTAGMSLSTELKIATWNIDFMRPQHLQRYTTAFDHLQDIVSSSAIDLDNETSPTIILIQEIKREFFSTITSHPFFKEYYTVTDVSGATWANKFSEYGTMTLIPKSLEKHVAAIFRTPFPGSKMGRDALYVDLLLQSHESDTEQRTGTQGGINGEKRYLRIVNVHLESLRGTSDTERPMQLSSTVQFLSDENVFAGIVAGDMNPIGPHDGALPTQLGLVDAWCANYRRRKEAEGASVVTNEAIDQDVEGHTWGYQPVSRRFSPVRMDKILMKGGIDVVSIKRVGVGVRVKGLGTDEAPVWASDHYGLLGHFRLSESDVPS